MKTVKMDSKAVSPVIGVMLMLVVTVLLAAAVSSYTGSISLKDRTPSAQFDAHASYSDGYIRLDMLSGDSLHKSNLKIRIETSHPLTSGYVNMSNVTFLPHADYISPGDSAFIYFTKSPYGARFTGPDIRLSIAVGDVFKITVIDKDTGNPIWSAKLVMNP